MNINKVYILEDRGIIYINGDDSENFLQNLISNDISRINENFSTFASLLSPQGKYLFEFIIVKYKKGFLIECEKTIVDNLLKLLNSYKLRSKIEILNLSNEFVIAVLEKDKFLEMSNAQNKCGYTIKFREDPIFLDPRSVDLGARIIINLEKLHLSLKKLNLKSANVMEYYKKSFDLGIPQKNLNELNNKLFGIECNLEELNGLDFKKGCYIGQENTARIKLKAKLNKRLFGITLINGELSDNLIIDNKNKEIGKLLIKEPFPFGLIKFKEKEFNFNNFCKCGTATITINKPFWNK